MDGSIFSANTIAGIPVIEAKSDHTTHFGGDVFPRTNALYDLGSDTKRWNTVYTETYCMEFEAFESQLKKKKELNNTGLGV